MITELDDPVEPGERQKQIVRPAGEFDYIPAYSTCELLLGVCHITYVPRSDLKRLVVANARQKRECSRKGGDFSAEASRRRFAENMDEIYQELRKQNNKRIVGKMFGIGPKALKKYLKEAEVTQFEIHSPGSKKTNRGCPAARIMAEKSRSRFEEKKDEIIEAVESRGITFAAKEYKFHKRTIQKFMEMENA